MAVPTMGERFDDISLGSDRLRGVCPDFNFGREEMGTNLMKRRQKCGKRHNLEDQAKDLFPLDQTGQEKMEDRTENIILLRQELMLQRDQGYQEAKRLAQQEIQCFIDGFDDHFEEMGCHLEYFQNPLSQEVLPADRSPSHLSHMDILTDLEATYAHVEAVAEIKLMKHTMTPKVPKLHNRILSDNILDQSLGLLHNSTLEENILAKEVLDQSQYSHYNMIEEDVCITQDGSVAIAPKTSDDNIVQMNTEVGGAEAEDTACIEIVVEHVEDVQQDSEFDETHTDKIEPIEVANLLKDCCFQLDLSKRQDNNLVSMTFVTPRPALLTSSAPVAVSTDLGTSLGHSVSSTNKKSGIPEVILERND